MAYGIAVLTTEGLTNLASIRSLRKVHEVTRTNASGSFTVSSAVADRAIPQVQVNDGKDAPSVTISGTTVTYSALSELGNPSTNFTIHFLKMV